MLQRGTHDGTLASDGYRNLADLFGLGSVRARIVGGVLQAQTNAAVFRIASRDSARPSDADVGTDIAAGSSIGLQASDEWHLDEVWVRNAAAGSNARIVFTGTLEV